MRGFVTSLIVCLLGLGVALAVVFSGLVEVAASSPHPEVVRRLLRIAMEQSVERRAASIVPPPSLSAPGRLARGFAAYDDMCVVCHAAPGREPSVIARGLSPEPPRLSETVGRWTDAELFWIVEHGIRMTGMPSFGATHESDELWDLVVFLRQLETLSPQEYERLRAARQRSESAPGTRDGAAAHGRRHRH